MAMAHLHVGGDALVVLNGGAVDQRQVQVPAQQHQQAHRQRQRQRHAHRLHGAHSAG